MTAYYNEIDGAAAHVLECLIAENVIAPGVVDRRSIRDVQPSDLDGFAQCHFFAGGGLWSVAARLAGWPDDKPLWTGSCPCQPFSVAGKGAGTDDPRHLWPDFFRFIRAKRPAVVVGEQVAGTAGYGWFDGVRADLAREGFASRCVDIPSLAVDAPNIRNRQYWLAVADADESGCRRRAFEPVGQEVNGTAFERHDESGVGDAEREGLERFSRHGDDRREPRRNVAQQAGPIAAPNGRNGSYWSDHEWLICHDGKARRTKPGLRLLASGIPGRVDLWRIAGNAINPEVGAEVLRAYLETENVMDAA